MDMFPGISFGHNYHIQKTMYFLLLFEDLIYIFCNSSNSPFCYPIVIYEIIRLFANRHHRKLTNFENFIEERKIILNYFELFFYENLRGSLTTNPSVAENLITLSNRSLKSSIESSFVERISNLVFITSCISSSS